MTHDTTDPTRAFRRRYAAEVRPARYSGRAHVISVFLIGGSAIGLALWIASASGRWADVWIVPATVLIANIVEYLAHRGPMHHRLRGLGALHTRHSARHHRYFTREQMHFESAHDFHAVLFPPVLLLFFGGITALLGLLAALFLPTAAAALFVATGVAYYLVYEVLHFLYHVPPHWKGGDLPVVRRLAALHHLHHDPRLMQQRNFNLVFPLVDWIAGTLHTGAAPARPHAGASAIHPTEGRAHEQQP